ncbi:MAG: Clp1/GlmU family protein [Methanomicrobiaceae archaeon]|nr:Clp1/GlmU family protein [Methanomicrobiaceae archaeon]
MIRAQEEWGPLREVLCGEGGTVYVLGMTDRGKSTFCRHLIEELSGRGGTGYLDLDCGQSTIGPPTTLGLGIFRETAARPAGVHLRFAGSTSPRGHFIQVLAGAACLRREAEREGLSLTVIDSPGYVQGAAAAEFQIQLIDCLRPDHLVAFQRCCELESILAAFRHRTGLHIHRFAVSPAVRVRSRIERQRSREKQFRDYFAGALAHEIPFRGLGIHGDLPETRTRGAWRNRLVALCDAEQMVLALGIIDEVDLVRHVFCLHAPPLDPSRVACVHVGSLQLDLSGKER